LEGIIEDGEGEGFFAWDAHNMMKEIMNPMDLVQGYPKHLTGSPESGIRESRAQAS